MLFCGKLISIFVTASECFRFSNLRHHDEGVNGKLKSILNIGVMSSRAGSMPTGVFQ